MGMNEQFIADRVAMDFSDQKQMDRYLKDHPDADKSKHRVVKHDPKNLDTHPFNLMRKRKNEEKMKEIGKHFKKDPKDLTVDEITQFNQRKSVWDGLTPAQKRKWDSDDRKDSGKKAGDVGTEIVGLDVEDLINLLNTAYADEWMAYHQYWIGAKVLVGPMRPQVEAELNQHADDEEEHADKLADRIIQLGGTPVLSPEEWFDSGSCGFEAPTDTSVRAILDQNIKGEQCAIRFYQDLLNMVRGKDDVTFELILDILADEVEHEEDLQMLAEDMDS
jgi:bacterioferritin